MTGALHVFLRQPVLAELLASVGQRQLALAPQRAAYRPQPECAVDSSEPDRWRYAFMSPRTRP